MPANAFMIASFQSTDSGLCGQVGRIVAWRVMKALGLDPVAAIVQHLLIMVNRAPVRIRKVNRAFFETAQASLPSFYLFWNLILVEHQIDSLTCQYAKQHLPSPGAVSSKLLRIFWQRVSSLTTFISRADFWCIHCGISHFVVCITDVTSVRSSATVFSIALCQWLFAMAVDSVPRQ